MEKEIKFEKKKIKLSGNVMKVRRLLKQGNTHSVCEEAKCPNISECLNKNTTTFLIMGDLCTRSCGFCSVRKGMPAPLNIEEGRSISEIVGRLKIRHVVITSVTRDDLPDSGIGHFCMVLQEINKNNPEISIEILTPDFKNSLDKVDLLLKEKFSIFNHNMETVRSLYPEVRPQAVYDKSLALLSYVKKKNNELLTKSGFMLGLGETVEEVFALMEDLKKIQCDILTIGQYLKPLKNRLEIKKVYSVAEFEEIKNKGMKMGFKFINAGPYVRSSYNAEEVLKAVKG